MKTTVYQRDFTPPLNFWYCIGLLIGKSWVGILLPEPCADVPLRVRRIKMLRVWRHHNTHVSLDSARQRSLAPHGVGTLEQVKMWSLEDYVPSFYITELDIKPQYNNTNRWFLWRNLKKKNRLSVTDACLKQILKYAKSSRVIVPLVNFH